MKQLIAPIAIIVALIAFFVIIDRKDFYSGDNLTVQKETVTEKKPATVTTLKPVEQTTGEPIETKPVVDTKPTEKDTVAEEPSETKPAAETKPVEMKSVTETKPIKTKLVTEETLAPAAIPVVTAEEAEKLNEAAKEFALAEKERREPFFRLYQDSNIETLCFEGTIRATSTIPDPTKNDYDNCLYALFIELDSLLSDVPGETKIPYEVIVNTPIMKEKKILQDNKFFPGDKVWCTCAEYDAMPQNIQEIQLSDDIQSYEHQQYYSMTIHKITAFQKGGNRNFAKREITVLPLQILPKEEKAVIARKKRIQSEIQRIEEELKKHGGTFESWKEEYKPIIEKYNKLSSEEYKVWINDSYFACGKGEPSYKTKEFIEGLQPYKKYLEDNNIDFIMVRIPNKWEFSRCVLTSDVFQENPAWVEHYYECLKNDIEIVDPMPEMWEHRFDFPLFYYYNVQSETHPFEGQAFMSAKVLSNVLKRYSYSTSETPLELEDCALSANIPRNFWPEGNSHFNPVEHVRVKRVIQDGKTIGGLTVNTGSPFLFLSHSFFAHPNREQGASVPAYTAYFIKHIPDWFYQDGISTPMIRNLVSDSQALSNRKVVIMVGHPSFWSSSFPSFPKYITDKAKCISLENSLDFQSSDITNLDNGSFLFEKDEDNVTSFTQNTEMEKPNKYFDVQLSVPSVKDKGTCMLRVNFGTNSYIKTVISDTETKTRIDTTTLSPGKNLHTDFYIPIADEARKISIRFAPSYPDKQFSIKNIELWYY